MDGFCEQVVKCEPKLKNKIATVALISFFVFLELLCIFIYSALADVFFLILTLMIGITAVAIIMFSVPRLNKFEYDYSVVGNTFYIDKVINKAKRKKFGKININLIEDMGKLSEREIPSKSYSKKRDCSGMNEEEKYFCVFKESGKGYCLLIFSPNERILEGMKPSLNRDLYKQLFLKKA